MTTSESLFKVTAGVADVFRNILPKAGVPDTAGTCLYASVLLKAVVEKFTEFDARVRGGDGTASGYRDGNGVRHGHYWVEARSRTSEEAFVLDITADQFGAGAVVMLPLAIAALQYTPGCQSTADEGVAQLNLLPESLPLL